jgi:Flp pilus assembly pilin Flp
MKALMKKILADEKGLETVEYAIITGLIVVTTIGIISSIGTWVHDRFNDLNTQLP